MKITGIKAWQVDLPLHEGSYKWSGGKSVTVFDSTVIAVETDEGITGYSEVCPLGPFYCQPMPLASEREFRNWDRT